jgi:hypothetical protein
VAGHRGKIIFVPQGTMELCECFPASFQDAIICGRGFQPPCGWLISGCPFGTRLDTTETRVNLSENSKRESRMKIFIIIAAHLVAIALLFWCGVAFNDFIVQSQNHHAGLVAVFSVAFGIYSTAINFLYQRNQAFHLFLNRIWFRLIRTHTYWQPHFTMDLNSDRLNVQILDEIWEMFSVGNHGSVQRKAATPTTLMIALDELWLVRFRLDQNKLFMDFEQKLLVPSHLYNQYRQDDNLFKNLQKDGILSNVTIPWECHGVVHPIMITSRGGVVLIQNYQEIGIELQLVMDIQDKLLKKVWCERKHQGKSENDSPGEP